MEGTTGKTMQWMYDGASSKLDEEEYLLGKKITKLVDDNIAFMGRDNKANGDMEILEKLDYDNKVREDPLFAIRQKELEHRKEVLSNPVKAKKMQSLLKNALEKDLKGKGKLHKKHKKKKKKRYSSGSESDIDDDVFKKSMKDKNLRKMLKAQLKSDLCKDNTSDNTDSDPHASKHSKKRRKSSDRTRHSSGEKRRRKSSSDNKEKSRRHSSNKHRDHKNDNSDQSDSSGKNEEPRKFGLTNVKGRNMTNEERRKLREARQKMPSPKKEQVVYKRKYGHGFTKKLDKNELDRKRREMMESADVRNDQRKKNVDRFTKAEECERQHEEAVRSHYSKNEEKYGVKGNDFVHAIKMQNVSGGSLQDTMKRKKHKMTGKL